MAKQNKKKYYVVVNEQGSQLFSTWDQAKPHCVGQKAVKYKGFAAAEDALVWLEQFPSEKTFEVRAKLVPLAKERPTGKVQTKQTKKQATAGQPPSDAVIISSDGGSLGNPGPGGYGVVMRFMGQVKELSGGYQRTTNNRMELLGAITGLESLTRPCTAWLFTDSSYVVNGIEKGWAVKWRGLGWKRNKQGDPAKNADLWARLLDAVARHDVTFHWVKGHAGNEDNERCDTLAKLAAKQQGLPEDEGYTH